MRNSLLPFAPPEICLELSRNTTLNVPLRMTVGSMATGCDVSESDVTGINVIRPKVGDYPWGVILIVRSVVWYSNGVTSGSHATYGHTQWYILYYYYGKKKSAGIRRTYFRL
jgi:hypothetical protein